MSAELRSNPDVRDGFKTIHFVQSIKTLLYWYGFSRVMAKSKNPIYVVRRTFHTFMEPENAYQSNQPCYKIRGHQARPDTLPVLAKFLQSIGETPLFQHLDLQREHSARLLQ